MSPEEFKAIPTPRTVEAATFGDDQNWEFPPYVEIKVAQQLERELAVCEQALKECADYGDGPSILTLHFLAEMRKESK